VKNKPTPDAGLTVFNSDEYVCRYCGGQLALHQMEDGLSASICWTCRKTGVAVKHSVYVLAHRYVCQNSFKYYTDVDAVLQEKLNVSKFCGILQDVANLLGVNIVSYASQILEREDDEDEEDTEDKEEE